jgi:hypothetical protein
MKTKRKLNANEYYLGDEPKIIGELSSKNDSRLCACLTWYSNHDDKKIYPWINEYLSNTLTKKEILCLLRGNSFDVRYLAIFLRMQNNGTIFSGDLEGIIDNYIAKIFLQIKNNNNFTELNDEIEKTSNVISIQDKILEKSRNLCSKIDDIFDDYWFHDIDINFNMYEWLQKNNVSPQSTQYIIDVYTNIQNELQLAYNKEDEDLIEAYSHIKKPKMKKGIAFIDKIINDSNIWKTNKKQKRKPRKKKEASISKQINKLKYQKEFTKYKLVSIPPEQVIGATQLWVFNTKYKYLTHYKSTSMFEINGTTLQNIDFNTSVRKTCRKPEEVLSKVLAGGKIILKKLMNELSTKPLEVNGRINQDCILLRSIK